MVLGLSSRSTLVLLNFTFFIVGLGIFSIGLWTQYDKNFSALWNTFEISKAIHARGLQGASLLLIISGLSSIFISFIGLYGSLKKEKCFLTTYCLFMCVILILEVAAASVFIGYQSQASEKLNEGLNQTVQRINMDDDKVALGIMNTIQPLFECCGCHGIHDYEHPYTSNITDTCKTSQSSKDHPLYFDSGCYDAIVFKLKKYMPIILGFSISLIIFQIFCLIMSVRLCTILQYDGYQDIS